MRQRRQHREKDAGRLVVGFDVRVCVGELESALVERGVEGDGALQVGYSVSEARQRMDLDLPEGREPARIDASGLLAKADDRVECTRVTDGVLRFARRNRAARRAKARAFSGAKA